MKLIKYYIAFALLVSHFALSAQQNSTSDKIVFLLRQDEHIQQAIKTGVDLKSKNISSVHPSEIAIIICGESVKNLNSDKMIETLEVACAHNITVYACGLSMKKFGLTKKDLPPSVQYIENGLIKSLELQKQGYLSVEL